MPQKTLKIGIDARMFSDAFTGIGRYNYELTKRLFTQTSLEGKKLQWVIFLNDPQFEQFEFPAHVKKVRVNAGHYSVAEQSKFLLQLYAERCDLVHFTHFNIPLGYLKPFVVTIHDTTISFYPGKKMNAWWRKAAYGAVIRRAVSGSRHIITVSGHTKKDVVKLFKAEPDKISPIHIAPSSEFKPVSEAIKKAVKEKYKIKDGFLLYTGNWREHKNLVGLIKAFAILKKEAQFKDLKLVITGKADPFYPEVKETIKSLNLKDDIELVGLVDIEDLVALFNAATVYVCPSFYEGFGLPPIEAMGCGTPVATANVASLPEVCGDAAAFFDPHSVDDMAKTITSLLTNEAKQAQLQAKGFEQIKNFSWDDCASSTLEVYKKAL